MKVKLVIRKKRDGTSLWEWEVHATTMTEKKFLADWGIAPDQPTALALAQQSAGELTRDYDE